MQKKLLIAAASAVVVIAGGFFGVRAYQHHVQNVAVQQTAAQYTHAFAKRDYAKLADAVNLKDLPNDYTKKALIARNQAVFDRVGASAIKISHLKVGKVQGTYATLSFSATMQTKIGKLKPQNYETTINKTGNTWKVHWTPAMLFPQMSGEDALQLTTIPATRGQIYDRNHQLLAQNGTVIQAGLIPSQLGTGSTRTTNLQKIATAWNVKLASLETLLNQSWVTKDTFVPVKVVTATPTLTGTNYQTIGSRTYPLGEAAAQLIGYVGNATADDIKKTPTLTADSQVGKAGLEQTEDQRLRGTDGGELYILHGKQATVLLKTKAKAGKDLTLTIDATKQKAAYAALNNQPGAVVTMAPQTGELLTLASAPSYDPNKFVNGISQSDYDAYANNKSLPFVSRFAQRYAPGSPFKILTAAIALQNKTITTNTTKSISGLKWQENSSWGTYKVTRTVDASPENMTQALVNSDNIWLAQTALKMGADAYLKGLEPLFKTQASLPLHQAKAQISNSGKLASDTLLADTAYGQGQLLLSPIQQAAMYSSIANGGVMQQPTLIKNQTATRTTVFDQSDANAVKTALTHVVSDATGTAHGLAIAGHTIAAKTGTAELKLKQDTDGKQNGFLVAMDADNNQYLTVSLMENVGSSPVVTAMKPYLESLY